MEKKKWTKPKLIVLVKGRPEEAILAACKVGYASGPEAEEWGCDVYPCRGQCDSWTGT